MYLDSLGVILATRMGEVMAVRSTGGRGTENMKNKVGTYQRV